MPTAATKTKEKIIDRINAPVLGTAKKVLSDFQEAGGYATQGDALSDLLLDYKHLNQRVKELEQQLAKYETPVKEGTA